MSKSPRDEGVARLCPWLGTATVTGNDRPWNNRTRSASPLRRVAIRAAKLGSERAVKCHLQQTAARQLRQLVSCHLSHLAQTMHRSTAQSAMHRTNCTHTAHMLLIYMLCIESRNYSCNGVRHMRARDASAIVHVHRAYRASPAPSPQPSTRSTHYTTHEYDTSWGRSDSSSCTVGWLL